MKDINGCKRSRPNSNDEEIESKLVPDSGNKTEKQKRKKLRKRRGSSSPEEDIIDGFVIASYSSLRCLEVVTSSIQDCLPELDKGQNGQIVEETSRLPAVHDIPACDEDLPRSTVEVNMETPGVKKCEKAIVKASSNGEVTKIDLSRQSPGQMTDDSSDSGHSGKGYICDGESEDELVPKEKKPKSSLTSSVTETKKEVIPIKVDLSKDQEEAGKSEKPFQSGFDSQKPRKITSPKSSSFHDPSLSLASSLTISQSSRAIPQSSWLPRLSSSFQKPLSVIEPCYRTTSYSAGPDALHQELNNRFLQSHSERERNTQHSKPSHEMHQHSHLHHHQHQHQHTHYYPSPLLATPYFPTPTPVVSRPGVITSPFSAPVPTYGSPMMSPFNKKTGKWCAAHVQIAWKIYCHQRVQGDISKDHHGKPEHLSISRPSSTIIPPYHPRHLSSSDFGFHPSHSHSSRFSVSPFGKPPALIVRSSASNTAVTSLVSAFSSVSIPSARRTASPVIITPSRVSLTSETRGRRSPNSGPSNLYPWLKSERKSPGLESEKTSIHTKRETQTKSPVRPSNNFSIQALASDRSEVRRSPLAESRIHPREHRLFEPRSFLESPLVPSLVSLDKRPIDFHPTAGSIDLNRNSLYSRLDPIHALYSHHMSPLTSHMAPYHYPGSTLISDYHGPPGMVHGSRDPMTSLVRTPDAPFYMRHHELDDRMSGRR